MFPHSFSIFTTTKNAARNSRLSLSRHGSYAFFTPKNCKNKKRLEHFDRMHSLIIENCFSTKSISSNILFPGSAETPSQSGQSFKVFRPSIIINNSWSTESNCSNSKSRGTLEHSIFWSFHFVVTKIIFHERSSLIKGRLPSKVIIHQRSSSIKSYLPSKDVSHQKSSSIKS